MGVIERILGLLFGPQAGVVKDTVEVFRENAEAGAGRAVSLQTQAMQQFGAEYQRTQRSTFDKVLDGINRLPRPAMALGTLGMFVAAMVNPLWFAERMQGIALVPEPLWWLLGVVVSFYFGARHQIKAQEFQRQIVGSMAHVPQVMENIDQLRTRRVRDLRSADTGGDAALAVSAVVPDINPALEAWKAAQNRNQV